MVMIWTVVVGSLVESASFAGFDGCGLRLVDSSSVVLRLLDYRRCIFVVITLIINGLVCLGALVGTCGCLRDLPGWFVKFMGLILGWYVCVGGFD